MATAPIDIPALPIRPARSTKRVPPLVIIGGAIFTVILVLAVLAPWIAPFGYDQMAPRIRLRPPDRIHLLGTDELGRDVLSRVMFGSLLSLMLGFAATLVSLGVGVPMGLLAGFFRGKVDETLMRLLD